MIDRDELMAMCGRDAPDPEPDTWAEEEASAREICGEISLEGSRFCVLDVGHSATPMRLRSIRCTSWKSPTAARAFVTPHANLGCAAIVMASQTAITLPANRTRPMERWTNETQKAPA